MLDRLWHDEQASAADGRLAGAIIWLAETAAPRRRRSRRDYRVTGRGDLHPDIVRLARALRATARFRAQRPPETEVPATARGVHSGARVRLTADHLHEQVLADLIRRPGSGHAVTAWLPAAVFTPGPRRELYELIRIHLDAGKPVDPLIIACEADLYQSLARGGDLREARTGESLPELALRLGALNPAPGTAAVLGQALLASYVCAVQFGPDWARSVEPIRPDAVGATACRSSVRS